MPSSGSDTLPSFADDPDAAGTLADDHPAVGKEVEAERAGQSFGDGLDVVGGGLRRVRRARLSEPLRNRRVAVGRGAAVFGPRRSGACAGGRGIAGARLRRERERGGRPPGRGRGDPLVHAVGKPALEVRLDRHRPRLDDPRSVVDLRAQQELEPLAVGAIGGRDGAALAQRDQRLAASHRRRSPSSRAAPTRHRACCSASRSRAAAAIDVARRARPVQAQQTERALFGDVGAGGRQPGARAIDRLPRTRRAATAARTPAAPASRPP